MTRYAEPQQNLGEGITKLSQVVDDFSSKLDLPLNIQTVESVDADHRQMTKFASSEDAGYRAIVSVLKKFIRSDVQNKVPLSIRSKPRKETVAAVSVPSTNG